MEQIKDILPWIVNLAEFGVMAYIVLRVVTVLDHALARAQSPADAGPIPVTPAKPPATPVVVPPEHTVPAPTPAPAPAEDEIIDDAFVNFLKHQEGFVAKAAWDYKQYTNGYGTKAQSPTEVIDEAEALRRLHTEALAAAAHVRAFAPGLPKGATQALIDLTFNAGPGWEHEHLGAAVKAGDLAKAKEYLQQYVHAGGQVLDALVKRRAADVAMFDHPL